MILACLSVEEPIKYTNKFQLLSDSSGLLPTVPAIRFQDAQFAFLACPWKKSLWILWNRIFINRTPGSKP